MTSKLFTMHHAVTMGVFFNHVKIFIFGTYLHGPSSSESKSTPLAFEERVHPFSSTDFAQLMISPTSSHSFSPGLVFLFICSAGRADEKMFTSHKLFSSIVHRPPPALQLMNLNLNPLRGKPCSTGGGSVDDHCLLQTWVNLLIEIKIVYNCCMTKSQATASILLCHLVNQREAFQVLRPHTWCWKFAPVGFRQK